MWNTLTFQVGKPQIESIFQGIFQNGQTSPDHLYSKRNSRITCIGQDTPVSGDPVVSCYDIPPKGTPVPTPSIKVQVIEERVDLSNNMTGRQMIGVGVRRVVLARGELDKLEGPQYAARRAELRREAGEAARAIPPLGCLFSFFLSFSPQRGRQPRSPY